MHLRLIVLDGAAVRRMALPRDGAITLRDAGVTQSEAATRATSEAPGEAADAVVWAAVSDVTQEESTLSATYAAFLTVATMLAACGVMLDNAILIVGAMVVGPEFGPLAGLCVALVRRQRQEAWRSVVTLVLGFVVAMLAGVAGMLSLTSDKSATLIGVAISVTTVPAAGNAALAETYHAYGQGWGSFVQLGVNLCGIVVAGTATLLAQRLLWSRVRGRAPARLER